MNKTRIHHKTIQVVNRKSDVLTFGKYKGCSVETIISNDASYILWLDENNIVKFPQDILNKAAHKASEQYREFLYNCDATESDIY